MTIAETGMDRPGLGEPGHGEEEFSSPDAPAAVSDTLGTTTPERSTPSPIPDRLYFRIGDVADLVGVKPYVLRYWETEFPMIAPQKSASGQRVYRRSDVETVLMIKHLLYVERYSIDGARKRLRELRKDGVLKAFKQETVAKNVGTAPEAPKAGMSRDAARAIIAIARELKAMADMPFQQLIAEN